MTPEELIALARRAVACKGWKWMAGMQTDSKFARVVAVDSDTGAPCASEEGAREDDCHAVWLDDVPVLPDLTDPATLGCLLALYEETRKMITWPDPVYTMVAAWGLVHPRTLEALVAALEAAP